MDCSILAFHFQSGIKTQSLAKQAIEWVPARFKGSSEIIYCGHVERNEQLSDTRMEEDPKLRTFHRAIVSIEYQELPSVLKLILPRSRSSFVVKNSATNNNVWKFLRRCSRINRRRRSKTGSELVHRDQRHPANPLKSVPQFLEPGNHPKLWKCNYNLLSGWPVGATGSATYVHATTSTLGRVKTRRGQHLSSYSKWRGKKWTWIHSSRSFTFWGRQVSKCSAPIF